MGEVLFFSSSSALNIIAISICRCQSAGLNYDILLLGYFGHDFPERIAFTLEDICKFQIWRNIRVPGLFR